MKLLVCSLFITLLILSLAFAADDKLASGSVSLYHLASMLGIEVSLEQVENIVVERAQGPYNRKTIMQVHRAVFNIPISEAELGVTPD